MKQLLSILSFVLIFSIQSQGQSSRNLATDGSERLVKMYPNPATSIITFDLQKDADKGLSIQLYSLIGKKMFNDSQTKRVKASPFGVTRNSIVRSIINKTYSISVGVNVQRLK